MSGDTICTFLYGVAAGAVITTIITCYLYRGSPSERMIETIDTHINIDLNNVSKVIRKYSDTLIVYDKAGEKYIIRCDPKYLK